MANVCFNVPCGHAPVWSRTVTIWRATFPLTVCANHKANADSLIARKDAKVLVGDWVRI